MRKVIVYCHGFCSSANTPKVDRLRAVKNSVVHAWDIDVDPLESLPYLFEKIDIDVMLNKLHEPCKVIFVGTSLGAWYASTLANAYGADAVLINPSYDPSSSLDKYGVSPLICSRYFEISWNDRFKYFIAVDDEVIDFAPVRDKLDAVGAVFVENSDHRFNGPEFDAVIAAIDAM